MKVDAVLAIPGNAGTAKCPKVTNVDVDTNDFPVNLAYFHEKKLLGWIFQENY